MVLVDNAKCSRPEYGNDQKEDTVKLHDKDRRKEKPTEVIAKNRYVYPRTGRLFTADALRDNLIFDSLERTNFMARGEFPIPHKRYQRDVFANQRKHFLFKSDAEKNKLSDNVEENKQNQVEDKLNTVHQSNGFLFMADAHKRNKRDTREDRQYKPNNDVTDGVVSNKDKDAFQHDKENENKPTKIYKTKPNQYGAQDKKNDNEDKATVTSYADNTVVVKGIRLEQAPVEPESADRKQQVLQQVDRTAGSKYYLLVHDKCT